MRPLKHYFLGLLVILMCQSRAGAAVALGPTCFVKAEVVEQGKERRTLSSGKVSEQAYLYLQVEEIQSGEPCNVAEGGVYRVRDNYPGSVVKGDVIIAGVELISTMGPDGVEATLIWSPLTDEEGGPILDKEKEFEIGHMQGPDQPVQ